MRGGRPRLGGWLLLLALLLAAAGPAGTASGGRREAHIWVRDSIFNPAKLQVPVGTTVVWHFEGRNPHTITADDKSWDSGYLKRGETFAITFDKPGRYPYHCIPHGLPGGRGMAGVILVGDAGSDGFDSDAIRTEPRPEGPKRLRVPEEYPTIQEAVDAAYPEDMILVAPGVYHESVVVLTPRLTIRGLDRNRTILDGRFEMDNGIKVLGADDVVIENMTARHYTLNGFYWTGVKGYRGSYLTAHNNGDYGIYGFDSRYGQFDHSYASANPDSGFYIGQCKPCDAIITDVISENNGLGYSGTNAGGNLTILNSVWRNNFGGIVPNTLDTEQLAPQIGTRIVNNVIINNGNAGAPTKRIAYPAYGVGVVVAGGINNIVEGNYIAGHPTYGVLVAPNIDVNFWLASGNVVRQNRILDSGRADIALAAPAGPGNCFEGNQASTSMPPAIESLYGCGSALSRLGGGEPFSLIPMLSRVARLEMGLDFKAGDWVTYPHPPEQVSMPDPLEPRRPAWPTPESEALKSLQVAVPEPTNSPAAMVGATSPMGVFQMGPWWGITFGLYIYLLPFILYTSWVVIGLWDLFRRDDLKTGAKLGWLAAILLLPLAGPVAYHAAARSPIPAALRFGLVGGGMALYIALALLAVRIAQA
ncbi:MAG: right-handed parallel beta-helix repeat-containing protein [Bacillota bacterium]